MPTKLLYLKDSYQKQATAKVTNLESKGKTTSLTLNQTIFYPQGGGQPADHGEIKGKKGSLKVTHVTFKEGQVIHQGKLLTGTLKKGNSVTLTLDWPRRYQNIQNHTAGHILDEAVKDLLPEFPGIKGCHGIGNKYYITFKGFIDLSHKETIQKKIDQIIQRDEPITTRMVTKNQIEEEGIIIPFKLPENKPLRLIQIGEHAPVPDGGTQLHSTGESWPITIEDFDYQNGHTTIHYTPLSVPTTKKTPPTSSLTLKEFQQSLEVTQKEFSTSKITPQTKTEYLGKKGKVNQLAKHIPQLSQKHRKQAGQLLNKLKANISAKINHAPRATCHAPTWLDITQPGQLPPMGHLHPITQTIHEIQRIFENIGFTRVRHPEIDYDYYVFESLNMPPDHPARDEWETFFMDMPRHIKKGGIVLTTHTSNGQVREMERVGEPPIRMINIAKCYRRQQDVTHTAMFHQFEGLVIDKDINIGHLKGTIDYFAHKMYGPDIKTRLRPFNFKFTEPSFEVDISCTICRGTSQLKNDQKCKVCKSGWLEVAGAGMVHPNVLKYGGINPDQYTGWAFGMGVERVLMLKPGLLLDDIRPLYGNNLEFLEQF